MINKVTGLTYPLLLLSKLIGDAPMKIEVQGESETQVIDVEVMEHDCYDLNDYSIEQYTFYSPSQEDIDNNNDRDQVGLMAVCNKCGADMPMIDVQEGLGE